MMIKRKRKFAYLLLVPIITIPLELLIVSCSNLQDNKISFKPDETELIEQNPTKKPEHEKDKIDNNVVGINPSVDKEKPAFSPKSPNLKKPVNFDDDKFQNNQMIFKNVKSNNYYGVPSIQKPAFPSGFQTVEQALKNDSNKHLSESPLFLATKYLKNDLDKAIFEVENLNRFASSVDNVNDIKWTNIGFISNYESNENYEYSFEISKNIEYNDEIGWLSFYYVLKNNKYKISSDWTYARINGFKSSLPDSHYFNLNTLQSKTTKDIQEGTPLFQQTLVNFEYFLKNYDNSKNGLSKPGIDFLNYVPTNDNYKMFRDYSIELSTIGYYGDFGKIVDEKLKYSPTHVYNNTIMKRQKYIDKLTSSDLFYVNNKSNTIRNLNLNDLIDKNPFGFLPSNLAQIFYYLKYSEIENIFNIKSISNISASWDDYLGEIKILLTDKQNKKYLYELNSSNTTLKKVNDFYQYIYDRSFLIEFPFFQYEVDREKRTFDFFPKIHGGTGWLVDRITSNEDLNATNKSITNDNNKIYEFLIASNLHVMDLSKIFDKYYTNDYYSEQQFKKQYWNNGIYDHLYNPKFPEKSVEYVIFNDKTTRSGYTVTALKRNTTINIPFIINKYRERDVTRIKNWIEASDYNREDLVYREPIDKGSKNYIDLVWYTPNFESNNIRAKENPDAANTIFGENKYDLSSRNGNIINGGADIAFAKIQLTKKQIGNLFPTLLDILETPQEKDWYVGLGTNNVISSNDSIFVGGFPSKKWDSIFVNKGNIVVKERQLFEEDYASYWKRYNHYENLKYNFSLDKYKLYEENFTSPEWTHTPESNLVKNHKELFTPIDHIRGMRIKQYYQNSILTVQKDKHDNNYLEGGASGSLAINSRFEAIGLAFTLIFNGYNEVGNKISLLKSIKTSDRSNWSHSILDDIKEKLTKENTTTVKLNKE